MPSAPPKTVDLWPSEHWLKESHLHPTLRKLHRLGADIDYVDFLCRVFILGDELRRYYGFDKRRGLLPVSSLCVSRAMVSLKSLLGDSLKMEPLDSVERLLQLQECALDVAREIGSYLDDLANLAARQPLASLLVQFAFPRELLLVRGKPHDRWGTFFLFAMTDHLWTLKPRKADYYRLTFDLFKGLRKDVAAKTFKHDAIMRVKRLKQQYSDSDLKSALAVLKSEYHRFNRFRKT